jgi:hypothetical protein
MAFVISPITYQDLDRIYPATEKKTMVRLIEQTDIVSLGCRWARDESRDIFLAKVHDRTANMWACYIFGWGDGIAVFEEASNYCTFHFWYVSDTLLSKLEETQQMIAEAFKFTGLMLKGNESSKLDRVPYAEFLPYSPRGVQK